MQRDGYQRISRVSETLGGAFVYAQASRVTGDRRVVCSGCNEFAGRSYKSDAGAIIAVSVHGERTDH